MAMMDGNKRQRKTASDRHESEEPVDLRRDDIIMGRGNQFSTHPGNVRFYAVIDQFLEAYFNENTRFGKSRVVQQAFKELSTTARFLRQDSASRKFYQISDADARQKISHAIRYRRQNSGSLSSRSSSPAVAASPLGETEGTAFFSREARARASSARSTTRQTTDEHLIVHHTPSSAVARDVIELFPDEDMDQALGRAEEYQSNEDGSLFEWPEVTSLSTLGFPDEIIDGGVDDYPFPWPDEARFYGNRKYFTQDPDT